MWTDDTLADCRFCSVISKANGEDPIGTAFPCDHWLIVEIPQPWTEKVWQENPIVQPLFALIKELIVKYKVQIRPIAIAPDPEYSRPGYTRLFYYQRPQKLFAEFEKQEFIVPDPVVGRLATAILQQLINQLRDLDLPDFEQYQQSTSNVREMLICTHGKVDVACARFGYPIYQKLREKYATHSVGKLRVWQCSHFGGRQFAPTLIDLPEGRYWGHLEPEVLDLLVHKDDCVSKLRQFYRDWVGLTKFEQIVEREIWMQEGWNWLKLHKSGQKPSSETDEPSIVRINCSTPDGTIKSVYEARVEVSDRVLTAWNSGENPQLKTVNQYRVSQLVKVTQPV